jgi:hypothetical protein
MIIFNVVSYVGLAWLFLSTFDCKENKNAAFAIILICAVSFILSVFKTGIIPLIRLVRKEKVKK